MQCTWKNCAEEATHPQLDRNKNQWANLCEKHHNELKEAVGAEPKCMLSAWIKATGGAEVAAARIQGGKMFSGFFRRFIGSD